MSQKIRIERAGPIAILRLANPPRNFLGPVVRADLSAALTALAQDDQVKGILLSGSEGLFSTGFNAAAPEMREGEPSLRALCHQIEDSAKPVVAVIFGLALGGGLELALAAHGRVALATAKVGMPDIALGLIPSAGGTQRLTRLLGADKALALLLSGQAVVVGHPRTAPLFDEIVPEAAEKAAAIRLLRMIDGTVPLRRVRDRADGFANPAAFQKALRDCREALGPDAPITEQRLLDCVERAQLLPFEIAEEFEELAFAECAESGYAQGLLHVQLALRRAHNMPEATMAKPDRVDRLGVVGGGVSAVTLVHSALLAGLPVTWFERSAEAIAAAQSRLDRMMEAAQTDPETRRACLTQLTTTSDLRDLASSDLVVEAVADNAHTKAQVFAALEQVMPATAVVLSHTGTLPIGPIGQAFGRVGQVAGLYLQPAEPRYRLAELIPGPSTTARSLVTAGEMLNRIGVLSIRCGSGGGTIGGRVTAALRDAAAYAVHLGATPAQVDAALTGILPYGVFKAMDMQGLAAIQRRAAQLHNAQSHALGHLALVDALLAEGRGGRSHGGGFYDWAEDQPQPRRSDVAGKALTKTEILHLCLGAMMNEGARLLREDVALRPSDIDLVMIRHHGFAAARGGPMNSADRIGLFTLARAMKPHAADAPRLFAQDPGIAGLIKNGEHLDVLNAIGRSRRRIG
ncbi:hypothetical protein E7681_03730 [Thalassobius vesicularis]|uniref:Uncharacterized protein n=1 Tax=Thalassobius vesicularis TaxID=1294297 RepID=A0A4S3MB64_9RHOB|nr:enoyl-CoA hydratase-related protein [Thalassobius vesicularis]THD75576.1 hypothetical protein E7681_03730 [Thalassobius vesicularis]